MKFTGTLEDLKATMVNFTSRCIWTARVTNSVPPPQWGCAELVAFDWHDLHAGAGRSRGKIRVCTQRLFAETYG